MFSYSRLIGIAAIITAITGLIAVFDRPSPVVTEERREGTTTQPQPQPSEPTPEPEPTPEQEEIESVVETSYITSKNAFKDLNTEELRKSYMGEALKAIERVIEGNSKLSNGEQLRTIDIKYDYGSKTIFENYQVINNEKVKIRASKKVNNVTYWVPNRCFGYQPEHTRIDNFTLEKTSTGWLISNRKSLHEVANIIYNQNCPTS